MDECAFLRYLTCLWFQYAQINYFGVKGDICHLFGKWSGVARLVALWTWAGFFPH